MRRLTVNEKRMFAIFMRQFRFCWACGYGKRNEPPMLVVDEDGVEYYRTLQNHHIVGGAGRVHCRENLARLCSLCHDLYHGARVAHNKGYLPRLQFNHVLWLKETIDPIFYDRKRLAVMSSFRIPTAVTIPSWYRRTFIRNRGKMHNEIFTSSGD